MNAFTKTATLACTLVATLGLHDMARAEVFDGNGRGLQIGVGVGASRGELDIDGRPNPIESRNPENGVAFNLSLGYGISERFAIHLATHAQAAGGGNDSVYGMGVTGLGASYRLAATGPTLYVSTTIGAGTVAIEDADERSLGPNAEGRGIRGAVGYQFGNGFRLAGGLMRVDADGGFLEADDEIELSGGELVLGWVWY